MARGGGHVWYELVWMSGLNFVYISADFFNFLKKDRVFVYFFGLILKIGREGIIGISVMAD